MRCGACGGSMTTLHRREGSYYECGHSRADHINTPACRSVKTAVVDELIARRLLEALAPEEIALALAAADEVTDRRARSTRAVELRVERARYDASAPSARSTPASPRTGSSPAASRPAGSTKLQRAHRGGSRARRAEHARRRSPRASRSRQLARDLPEAVGRRDHLREGPQAAAAHDDRRHHDHLPAHRPRAAGRDPLALGRQRAAHHPTTEDTPTGHTHPGRGDRADQTPRRRSHQRADRRATQHRRVARRHRRPVRRRARAMDPLAPQDPLPDQLGARRRADRQPARRDASASPTAPSTPGSTPASSPPAAGPPTGSTSRSVPTSSNNAASWSRTPFTYPPKPKSGLQEVQFEATVPTVADRVAQTVVAMFLEPGGASVPPGLLWLSAGTLGP